MPLLAPITLTGRLVSLEPLHPDHTEDLVSAARDGELWRLAYTSVPTPDQMAAAIDDRLERQAAGTMLPFVTRRITDGRIIGMTTFCNADTANRRVEIGYTWNARSAQRTGTNTDSKRLLLTHAFETVGVIAVEFRTHWLNRQSRSAIERLGAKQDGIMRNHQVMPDGTLRDTVVYSILPGEWPAIKAELMRRLVHTYAHSV